MNNPPSTSNVVCSIFLVIVAWVTYRPLVDVINMMFGVEIAPVLMVAEIIGCSVVVWMLVGPIGLIVHRKEMRDLHHADRSM